MKIFLFISLPVSYKKKEAKKVNRLRKKVRERKREREKRERERRNHPKNFSS